VYETLYLEAPDELPSINFVRECRVLVEVMGETITAIKLANASQWSQLWTDSTTRRQIPFTALIIGVLDFRDASGWHSKKGEHAPAVFSTNHLLSCVYLSVIFASCEG